MPLTLTKKCQYKAVCLFSDTENCIDNVFGCVKVNQEEAENPLKSRRE